MKKTFQTMLGVAAAALLIAGPVSAQELTTNGGFEAGDTSGWADFTGPFVPFTAEGPNAANAGEGDYFGRIANTTLTTGAVVKQANIGIGSVNPGDELAVSFLAKGTFEAGGVAVAEFFSELDGGGVSATEILGGQPFFFGTQTEWTPFAFTVTAGPDVSGGVSLQFVATTGGAAGSTAILDIDDVSVSIIPEPASMALMGLGGLALLARRRKA